MQILDEVVIVAPKTTSLMVINDVFEGGGTSFEEEETEEDNTWDAGGGGTGTQQTSDPTNNQTNPSSRIEALNNDQDFKAKIDSLKNKTSEKKESSYKQNFDGSYTSLSNTIGSSHQLNITIDNNTVGFVDNHLDDFYTGEYDYHGRPVIEKPIKIFSPNDILQFLMLVNRNRASNSKLSSIYATVVASQGIYMMKYSGNPMSIPSSLDFSQKKYELYIRELGLEKGLLKYINDIIGLIGIDLYKIESSNKIVKKVLNSRNEVISNNC